MENNMVQQGMDIVKEAVDADSNNDLEKALVLYKKGLAYLLTGIKYVKNEKTKLAIRGKVAEYMKRAEEINAALEKKSKKTITPGAGGGGDKKKKDADHEDGDDDKDVEAAKLQSALSQAIITEKPNIKWDDVAGLEQAKGLLQEAVILPAKFPQLFTGKRRPWKGILLYGPPGTGKSYLAKAVATESGASCFLSVSSSDLVSKFQGESERLVKQLFELARKNAPSIIFIDEVDSLCGTRSEGENESARRIKTEFLVQMDGVGKDSTGVLVLGATNTPWELDPAIRRRFEKRVYIPLPDAKARERMFKLSVGSTPNNLTDTDYKYLGQNSDGYSGSDISVLVRDALYEPVRTCQLATHFKKVPDPSSKHEFLWEPCSPSDADAQPMKLMDVPGELLRPVDVTVRHFKKALKTSKCSVSPEDLKAFEDWTKQFGQEG
jgi:vacuolar protein-sorting-associated protein 4